MFSTLEGPHYFSLHGSASFDHCLEGQLQHWGFHPHPCLNHGFSQQDNWAETINSGDLNIQDISWWLIFLLLWDTRASQPPKLQFPPVKWKLNSPASKTSIPTCEDGGWASQSPRVHRHITSSDPELELSDVFLQLWPNFSMMSTKMIPRWGALIPSSPSVADPRCGHWKASSQQGEDGEDGLALTWVCSLGWIHRIMESVKLENVSKIIKSNLWPNTTASNEF